jgi:hypothetical protein
MSRRKCSECGQPLPEIRLGLRLTPLQALVFDSIASNLDGINSCLVLERFRAVKPDASRKTIHVYVSHLNELLHVTGYRINKYRNEGELYWSYYLEKPRAAGFGRSRQLVSSR